jgi:hypothetical protein
LKFLLAFLLMPLMLFGADASVAGSVKDSGEPVKGAMVILQRLRGRDCAQAFESKKPSAKNATKLASCSEDLEPTYTDERGMFKYQSLEPDWYAVRILWAVKTVPAQFNLLCEYGPWIVGYYTRKDSTGRYDAMAQGHTFQLKSGQQKTADFSYDKPLATAGKCLTLP